MARQVVSKQTRTNWWIDSLLFSSALIATLSGIYFLFLPSVGFQGGRNQLYHVQILFNRQTWDDLHTWSGIVAITTAITHLMIHWQWVVSMARRTWKELTGKSGCMNPRGRWNLILNTIVFISFVLTAASGIYFLFVGSGRWTDDPMILFTRTAWDFVHTWASVILAAGVVIHFVIHWKWVTNVTRNMIGMAFPIHHSLNRYQQQTHFQNINIKKLKTRKGR